MSPNEPGGAHQPRHALAAAPHAKGPQLGVYPRCPVGLPAARKDRLDLPLQRGVSLRAG